MEYKYFNFENDFNYNISNNTNNIIDNPEIKERIEGHITAMLGWYYPKNYQENSIINQISKYIYEKNCIHNLKNNYYYFYKKKYVYYAIILFNNNIYSVQFSNNYPTIDFDNLFIITILFNKIIFEKINNKSNIKLYSHID